MRRTLFLLLLLVAPACAHSVDDGIGVSPGGGKADGAVADSTADAALDSSVVDSGALDSSVDGSIPDTAVPDTGVPDTESPDTEIPDTEPVDTGVPDTEPVDTGVIDTGPPTGSCTNCSAGVCSSSSSDELCFLSCFYSFCSDCVYDEPSGGCSCTGCF